MAENEKPRVPFQVTALTDAELDEVDPKKARPVGVDAWRAEAETTPAGELASEAEGRAEEGPGPTAEERDSETTPELTGDDASAEEAAFGDAGNGAAPFGGDLAGRKVRPLLEDEPSDAADIHPDQIEEGPESPPEEEEDKVTARPSEPRPTDASEWP